MSKRKLQIPMIFLSKENREIYNEAPTNIRLKFALSYYGFLILGGWIALSIDVFSFPKPLVFVVGLIGFILIILWTIQWVRYKANR